jgi:adenosylhomocysteine nucleosidase
MRLGIVAAFDREARMFTRRLGEAQLPENGSSDTLIALAGLGAARAHAAGERLLDQGADALLSWGVAAALDRGLAPGNLLAPKTVISVDLREYPVSLGWHQALCEHLAGKFVIHTDPLAESPEVLSTPAQKRALLLHTGAIAADMESAALAALAREANVPFVTIRAVSDTAKVRVPPWIGVAIDSAGRLSMANIVKQLALRPLEWATVSRLAFGFRAARATLTGVAEQVSISLRTGAL